MLSVTSAFISGIYDTVRKVYGRATITLQGNTTVYTNDRIMKMNILEEATLLNESVPSNELTLTMDNSDGAFNMLNFQNMYQIIASRPKIVIELGLELSDLSVEWLPIGTYFLSSWKNDITTKVITLIGNDYFKILSEISHTPTASTDLYIMAGQVLDSASIPTANRKIDVSLQNTIVNPLPERMDCRTALQYIAIAAQSALYQDRYGKVSITPLATLDKASNYITYPRTQRMVYGGYPSSGTYSLFSTGGGLRYIDTDYMYEFPEVSLDKSIYQLVIKIYATPGVDPTEKVYTNTVLGGANGDSFTINNPLIKTTALADKIADWYLRETNYNAVYKIRWRQNFALETLDVVLIEDSFNANKQTRIYRNEINYEGFLEGNTESRGGI